MIIYKNNISILKKLTVSLFAKAGDNVNHIGQRHSRIGSSRSAIGRLMEHSVELKYLMDGVINISKFDQNWGRLVDNYLNSFSVAVSDAGLSLNLNLEFDINDIDRKENIDSLKNEHKIDTSEKLRDYCLKSKSIDDFSILRYARAVNPSDYVLYLYCLGYADVANKIEDLDKSPKIRFYIYREAEENKRKEAIAKQQAKTSTEWAKIAISSEKVEDAFYLYNVDSILTGQFKAEDVNFVNMVSRLTEALSNDPVGLSKVITDKAMSEKAEILKIVVLGGILEVVPNTEAILTLDGTELGKNLNEVVKFFSEKDNEKIVNGIKANYDKLRKLKK